MSAQILWYCHLYRPDRKYLEEKIYPVVREVALFYCSFAEKCPRDVQRQGKVRPELQSGTWRVRRRRMSPSTSPMPATPSTPPSRLPANSGAIGTCRHASAKRSNCCLVSHRAGRCRPADRRGLDRLQVPRDRRAQYHRARRAGIPGRPGDLVLSRAGKGIVPQHHSPDPASRLQFHGHVQRRQARFSMLDALDEPGTTTSR